MLNKKNKTYKVEFTTFFPRSPYLYIALEAKNENHAQWVARNLCRFGYISDVEETDEHPAYNERTHAFAYDEDYEVYS
tara:strand:+ start:721 stop:954 length:234 start_codon:yes stop_codon:yes gene_type:complete